MLKPIYKLYVSCMYTCNSILDQSVNKLPFPNKTALQFIFTLLLSYETIDNPL